MKSSSENETLFLLTFGDLVNIAKKNKIKIRFCTIFAAFLAIFYGLTRPVQYQTEATFKEKAKSQSGLGKSLSEIFLVGESNDSDALTIMKSRKLIEQLVRAFSLQAEVVQRESRFFTFFQTIKNNLIAEYALWNNKKEPSLADKKNAIQVVNAIYEGEVPLVLKLIVRSPENYAIFNKNKLIGEGSFGQSFSAEDFTLTLALTAKEIKNKEYILVLQPLASISKHLRKQFIVEADKSDKTLLKIIYKHPDRQQAVLHVNGLMKLYQDHILNEHKRISGLQVDYLVQRQQETGEQLKQVMTAHADELASDLFSTGFATSEKAMEFLANNQKELKHKLLSVGLEIERLESLGSESSMNYEKLISIHHSEIVNRLTAEIRSLKQQADALRLAIGSSPLNLRSFRNSFEKQLKELDEFKQCTKEAKAMLISLENNEMPQAFPRLLNNPKFIVNVWYDKLIALEKNKVLSISSQEEWQKTRETFISYLSHLIHHLYVHQRNIEERLAHQQSPLEDFQGINLNTAKEIYITYSKELSDVEAQTIQKRFIISQMSDPDFEISSLSTLLTDPISAEMISKTSHLILALKDQDNRSPREQERLKADLNIQKSFLTAHLEQSVLISELRQKFLKEKIQTLQSINLSLIQEQIFILENQMKEYLSNSIASLRQEQMLLEKNLAELRVKMASLPQKWAAERVIEQQMKINQNMVEEITKLVESKNISSNLEKIQSTPIDSPLLPLHPRPPHLLFLGLVGALFGSFLGFAWFVGKSTIQGVEASPENLRVAGQHVSGTLLRDYSEPIDKNPLLDSDLETLRRLISFFVEGKDDQNHHNGEAVLLMENCGPRYVKALAELMAKRDYKIIIIDLFVDYTVKAEGVLQYLNGEIPFPKILKEGLYDWVASGGTSRYANELVGSSLFTKLLDKLSREYDWILVSSQVSPISAEAESLLKLFPNAAISLKGEVLEELRGCLNLARNSKIKVSYIFTF